MNTAKLKKYAPQARRQFISAVSKQLNQLGIYSESQISPVKDEGSLLVIEGKTFDVKIKSARARLVKKVQLIGYNQLVEQVAYTWINRLCAIRYMEIHNYLEHGFRVLSHPTNSNGFEILDHAQDAAEELGLNRESIIQLKLAGNKDEELYRELLLGQCHKLHEAMPFLFDALDDETELLLPDNLIRTDSILRGLVDDVPEEDWLQVEVIGWLYQFYISEKKDLVMGKVVKSEDIPAATQLFTPNWIVKYLVQNSVGRQWLQTYPNSAIKSQMDYYIEPAEQSEEVIKQLGAITPESIDPLTIKVLDPACGSGHILIEAYNILKAIYEERGFRSRDIPKLIIENNLYGLDIDDRAAQLSGFALMMMARNDDKRIFTRNVRLNVLSLQESKHLELHTLWKDLNLSGSWKRGTSHGLFDGLDSSDEEQDLSSFNADNRYQLLKRTLARFTQAKTFGSLIEVPAEEYEQLKELLSTLDELQESGDSMQKPAAKQLIEFVNQALVLSIRYDAIVANPPYMGSKGMNTELKGFTKKQYPNSKSDLFSIFMERAFSLLKVDGLNAQVNMQAWMFLSTFENFRKSLIEDKTIFSMIHLGARAFGQISGEIVQTTAWVIGNYYLDGFQNKIFRLVDGNEEQKKTSLQARQGEFSQTPQAEYKKIPGSPIAYWIDKKSIAAFSGRKIGDISTVKGGMSTSNNNRFVRYWHELDIKKIGMGLSQEDAINSNYKWFPYNKGGAFKKWYGNDELVVNWENNGSEIKLAVVNNPSDPDTTHWSRRIFNTEYFFKRSVTWGDINTSVFSARLQPQGAIADSVGIAAYYAKCNELYLLSFLNSPVLRIYTDILCPTIHFNSGPMSQVPLLECEFLEDDTKEILEEAIFDWNSSEKSIGFTRINTMTHLVNNSKLLSEVFLNQFYHEVGVVEKVRSAEERINKFFIDTYQVSEIVSPDVQKKDITLECNEYYLGMATNSDIKQAKYSRIIRELVSYALGCMMGRYSVERSGLMYANSSNEGFAEQVVLNVYGKYPADEDGIIPLTDKDWYKDDATNRFAEFVQVVWGSEHLQENLDFIAETLCINNIKPKKSESAMDTIRRYLSTQFYKDHLKTYKKRPIYWLFSSGKQKAFECLVYLHRYNEGTLSRMRTEYVTPLHGKYHAYVQRLQQQLDSTELTNEKNQLKKELDTVIKKQVELREFDDKLKHFADMRISLDLDDGVKVNYGKFGDLLADVKAITGSAED